LYNNIYVYKVTDIHSAALFGTNLWAIMLTTIVWPISESNSTILSK